MSDVRHTPGPLTSFKSTADFWNVVKGTGPFDPSLASVHPNTIAGVSGAECEANARLFAAAPELLEVLKAIGAPDEVNLVGLPDTVIRGMLYAAVNIAKDAIAKAEGRT